LLDLDSDEPRATVITLPGLDDRLEQGRALGAELAAAHTDLAEQMLAAGRAAEAEPELERALLYDCDHARAYQRLAEVYASLGCPVKAREFRRLASEKGWEGE
jgi:Tfp pilus assembly protein PilF